MPKEIKQKLDREDLRLYGLALHNRWPKRELHHLIGPVVPLFIYSSLMLPWVLARVLGTDSTVSGIEKTAGYMTRATLRNHFRVINVTDRSPTVVSTKRDVAVDGMLVAGLRSEAEAKIEDYMTAEWHERRLEEIEIATEEDEALAVCAHVYVWNGDFKNLEAKSWTPLEYMRRGQELDPSKLYE